MINNLHVRLNEQPKPINHVVALDAREVRLYVARVGVLLNELTALLLSHLECVAIELQLYVHLPE